MEPQKFDTEKVRVELLPPDALEEIARVLTFGAVKYAAGNWATGSGFKWTRLYGAMLRHVFAWARGEDLDPESGISHLAHAGCMLLFLLSHVLRRHGTDDRNDCGLSRVGSVHKTGITYMGKDIADLQIEDLKCNTLKSAP